MSIFGTFFNSFAATFDEGNVKDSFTDTCGTFINPSVVEGETNIIRISSINNCPNQKPRTVGKPKKQPKGY